MQVTSNNNIIKAVENWLDRMVIGLNLCPFAKGPRLSNSIHFIVSNGAKKELVLLDLITELNALSVDETIDTTLLILPNTLGDFHEFNQFLDLVDDLLLEMKLEGVFQIATFHPQYQFADTKPTDVENYTNRSPYPILHILRESSLDLAIGGHPNTGDIPIQNSALLRDMGQHKIKALLESCFQV